jgi:hypothetical protein
VILASAIMRWIAVLTAKLPSRADG